MVSLEQVAAFVKRLYWPRRDYLQVSKGDTSKGLPIVLNRSGLIDQSMLSGTDLAEYIADIVGAMVTGNTETNLDVTYQDGDNTLDFSALWAEGTWTPQVFDAAIGGNQGTAGTAAGFYTKFGKVVNISCLLVNIDTTGLTAGNTLHIRNLPFTSKSTASYRATALPQINMVTFGGYVEALLINNTAYVRLFENISGANAAALTVSDYTSGSAAVVFSMTYWTD